MVRLEWRLGNVFTQCLNRSTSVLNPKNCYFGLWFGRGKLGSIEKELDYP